MSSRRKWLLTRLQIGRRLYAIRDGLGRTPAIGGTDPDAPYFAGALAFRQSMPALDSLPSPSSSLLEEYRRNIRAMAGIGRANNIRMIFVTQPALWSEHNSPAEQAVMWMATYHADGRWSRLPSAMAFRMLSTVNATMLETCRTDGLACLDLAAELPRSLDIFYDDMHFNEQGAKTVVMAIARTVSKVAP